MVDTLVFLPIDVVWWASENITFVSSCKDENAFCVSKEDLNGKGIIVLCESLKQVSILQQVCVIAHEIAHHMLMHDSRNLTEEKYNQLDREANKLALKWMESKFGVEAVKKLRDELVK